MRASGKPQDEAAAVAGVAAAVRSAAAGLAAGDSALDAAVAAVVALEENPLFNAGTGAALNRDGDIEMDACVMCGHDLRCGAVAGLRRVRNPVLVARCVMERTPHVMLAGEGALRFARAEGFADYDPLTRRARDAWLRKRAMPSRNGRGGRARPPRSPRGSHLHRRSDIEAAGPGGRFAHPRCR